MHCTISLLLETGLLKLGSVKVQYGAVKLLNGIAQYHTLLIPSSIV